MTMATTSPWLAVAAGMLTVGAPCVLPMLPVVLGASVSGADSAQRTRPLFIALGFALSFAAVALLFSSFTQVLGVSQEGLRRFAAGKTIVLVTHRTSLLDLVDRLIVLDQGQIVADGPKAQVVEALQQGRIGRAG